MNDVTARPNSLPWPPIIYLAAIAVSVLLNVFYPLPWFGQPLSSILFVLDWLMIAAFVALNISAIRAMRRAGTTVRPDRGTDHLVTDGPFSFTRNPLYGACAPHIAQGAQRCRDRGDRGGLVRVHGRHQDRVRRAQQVSATPKRVVSIVIGRSAPRPSLALEVPPTLLARAGEVIEIELSCAVRESGARAPWTGGVMSLTQRCREPSSNEAPWAFRVRDIMNWKGSASSLATKRPIQIGSRRISQHAQ